MRQPPGIGFQGQRSKIPTPVIRFDGLSARLPELLHVLQQHPTTSKHEPSYTGPKLPTSVSVIPWPPTSHPYQSRGQNLRAPVN